MKLIIIGAGPGGYETALAAAKRGIEVTIFESGNLGGTCLNEGCIPTKALCRNAEIMEEMRTAEEFGVYPDANAESSRTVRIDMQKVQERKQAIVSRLGEGIESLLKHKLITLVRAHAEFKDEHTVVAGGIEYAADNIIIASGSVAASLPVPGANLPNVLSSKEMLELNEIPESLCVIGGGVIGLEFASIFAAFGSKVTVLEYCKELLPRFDTDIAKRLKQVLGKRGIEIITSAQVLSIEEKNNGLLSVKYLHKESEKYVETGKVLMAVGRRANFEGLGIGAAGIETTRRGIAVNEFMQTNVPHIYAIGDVNGLMMLAHAATFQGLKALNHMTGTPDNINLSVMPAAVFTNPEVATVGLTEEECKNKGLNFKCLKSFYRSNGKAVSMGSTEGYCKLIYDADSNRILGCHLLGAHASDLISEVCALINCGATVRQAADIIHSHPSLSEILQTAYHA